MAKATFDIKSIEIPKPLYAGVGATDIAYTAVKEYASDVQKKLTQVQKDVTKTVTTFDPKSLGKQAVDAAAARRIKVEATVADLQAEAKTLPTKVTTTVNENVALASAAYDDFAKRGETVVTRIRKTAPTASVTVKTTPTKAASVKVSATSKPVVKQPARKAPTKKATVKKAAAKKA
jgi:hypothetical protein